MTKKLLAALVVFALVPAMALGISYTKYFEKIANVVCGDLICDESADFNGTVNVDGATTLGGAATIAGAASVSGSTTLTTATVSTVLTIGDGGGITYMNGGSAVVAYQTGAITMSGLLPGGTYYVGLSWADTTNDPGKCTWAITTDTLTVTCATATSGTVHAVVIGK